MNFIFLTNYFNNDYPISKFPELMFKSDRPYIMIYLTLNNYTFALPLRSTIKHDNALITDKKNRCGIDYSKSVYISKQNYIDNVRKPHIRNNEFNALRGKEYYLKKKFLKYIRKYVNAKKSEDPNKLKCFITSTLPYFENLIDYENDILLPLGE
ncbi:MAG: hypothetical protein E7510_11570 [Ruminococcus sp.]|nr:hypothetical protein [Ruminococcus sp.]